MIPQQRALNDPTVECCGRDAADCDCAPVKPKRVITTRVLVITRDESITRRWWEGMTEDEIIASIEGQKIDDQIQEFVDDAQSTRAEDLFFVQTVKIVDRN